MSAVSVSDALRDNKLYGRFAPRVNESGIKFIEIFYEPVISKASHLLQGGGSSRAFARIRTMLKQNTDPDVIFFDLISVSSDVYEVVTVVSEDLREYYLNCIRKIFSDVVMHSISAMNGSLSDYYKSNPSLKILADALENKDGKRISVRFSKVSFMLCVNKNGLVRVLSVIMPKEMLS